MNKPDYSLVKKRLENQLIETEKIFAHLQESEFDREAHYLIFEILEVKFKLEKSIKHCSNLGY